MAAEPWGKGGENMGKTWRKLGEIWGNMDKTWENMGNYVGNMVTNWEKQGKRDGNMKCTTKIWDVDDVVLGFLHSFALLFLVAQCFFPPILDSECANINQHKFAKRRQPWEHNWQNKLWIDCSRTWMRNLPKDQLDQYLRCFFS